MRIDSASTRRAWLVCALWAMGVSCDPGPPAPSPSTKAPPTPVAGPAREASVQGARDPKTPLFVVLGGDVMLQEQIHTIARERGKGDLAAGYAWFFQRLEPILRGLEVRGDVRFVVNLESPVARQRREPRSFPPLFNGPPEALQGLRRAGVDVVTVANNHALDQGRAGMLETVRAAREAGLVVTGAGTTRGEAVTPAVLGEDPSVALLAYFLRPGSSGEPGRGGVLAVLDEDALADVEQARTEHDAVIVTVHWVGEFASRPREELVTWASRLVEAGADAVICHGSHVPGPMQVIQTGDGRQGLVAYSLGNLLSNMGWEVYPGKGLVPGKNSAQRRSSREEVLAVLRFESGVDGQVLTGYSMVPLWLMDNRYASFRKGAGPRLIYPVPMPLCRLPDPVDCPPASTPQECVDLEQMLEDACDSILDTLASMGEDPTAP